MPAKIRKLLIVRVKYMRSGLLTEAGFAPRVQGQPLPVSPLAWKDEAGLSHWGFVLEGLTLKEFQALQAWDRAVGFATVLPLDEDPETALAKVGLRINEAALEDEPAQK